MTNCVVIPKCAKDTAKLTSELSQLISNDLAWKNRRFPGVPISSKVHQNILFFEVGTFQLVKLREVDKLFKNSLFLFYQNYITLQKMAFLFMKKSLSGLLTGNLLPESFYIENPTNLGLFIPHQDLRF